MPLIFLTISFLIFILRASAEIIYLKSGGAIKGEIVNRAEQYIEVDRGTGTPMTYNLEQIRKIDSQEVVSSQISKSITLQFNPPDGLSYKATLKKTVIEDPGKSGGHLEVLISKRRINVRRTPTGFALESVPISTKIVRDGLEVNNSIVSVLQNFLISYDLDSLGRIVAVHGYENLMKNMEARFSSPEIQSFSSIFNEQTFTEGEMGQWNSRIGSLMGRTVSVGKSWEGTEEYPLPTGGKTILHTTTDVLAQVPCGQGNCLKLRTTYRSGNSAEVQVSGQGIRLIDPATMLIHSEAITRTMKIRDKTPGQSREPMTITEKKEYRADFSASKL